MEETLKHVDSYCCSSIFSAHYWIFNYATYFIFNSSKPQSGKLIKGETKTGFLKHTKLCLVFVLLPDLLSELGVQCITRPNEKLSVCARLCSALGAGFCRS